LHQYEFDPQRGGPRGFLTRAILAQYFIDCFPIRLPHHGHFEAKSSNGRSPHKLPKTRLCSAGQVLLDTCERCVLCSCSTAEMGSLKSTTHRRGECYICTQPPTFSKRFPTNLFQRYALVCRIWQLCFEWTPKRLERDASNTL
jgi:hypothetical protein